MLTPSEIKQLIKHYEQRHLNVPDRRERHDASLIVTTLNHVLQSNGNDEIVEQVIEKLILRSRAGMEEYKTTLKDNPAPTIEWLNHTQDELLDAANYIQKLKELL